MGRTCRRKSATHEYRELLRDWVYAGCHAWYLLHLDARSPEGLRRIRQFHSDAAHTLDMVPAGFRRVANRKRRARWKQALREQAGPLLWEDGGMLPRERRSIRWDYW